MAKTAMQQLIHYLDDTLKNMTYSMTQYSSGMSRGIEGAIEKAKALLEEEKKQILNAYAAGVIDDRRDELKKGHNDYYSQTYTTT